MKNLGNLSPGKGSNHRKRRVGRGIGSGLGKTCGKGHKGAGQRKSPNVMPGFEGGQTPLYRRLPKRGFKNPFTERYNIVNLDTLSKLQVKDKKVTPETLAEAGLLRDPSAKVKILGRGELKSGLTIAAHKFSASAKTAIEKAKGVVEEI